MKVEIELTGAPSTGYDWKSSQEPDDQSYESRYPSETEDGEPLFGGQVFTKFVFENVRPGAELTFSYCRPWEENVDPREVVRVRVGS